jgi:hypothetical protein
VSSPDIFLSLRLTIGGRTTNIIGQQRSADMNNQPAEIAKSWTVKGIESLIRVAQATLDELDQLDATYPPNAHRDRARACNVQNIADYRAALDIKAAQA